ncbi:hypothetical protein EUX98_g9699 [Antrodiella citrinella]|uniref:Uncharacterized protein n=1 Tax=Antrodiella citrinella TaxID=2447956 RepID=A0A4S4LPX0_9APHY|nr:hypothetical protein EUX98_g9699 [Antrodiella citrinella]
MLATKFLIGAGVGIPASALCINRRLYSIASVRNISIGREERRRATIIDLCISVGIPMLVMILHYIVQGHRFNILEDIGCTPAIYNTLPAYPLVFMWPVLLSLISFVYAGLTLRAFWVRRIQFSELVSSASSMTVNRYFRLMLLSCLTMLLNTPLSAFSIYINTHGLQLSPWVSWSDAHYNFSFVEQIPAVIWRSSVTYIVSAEMSRWIYPFSALIFFGLFGFADEARRNYVAALAYVVSKLGLKPLSRAKKLGFTTALS